MTTKLYFTPLAKAKPRTILQYHIPSIFLLGLTGYYSLHIALERSIISTVFVGYRPYSSNNGI